MNFSNFSDNFAETCFNLKVILFEGMYGWKEKVVQTLIFYEALYVVE